MDKKTASELRKKAEEKLDRDPRFSREFADKNPKQLIQELKTHQIELEMQNETLREAQQLLEKSQRRYAGLFELAPVGYFALDKRSIVRDVNAEGIRLLGLPIVKVTGLLFVTFIKGRENLSSFVECMNSAVQSKTLQSCIIQMKKKNGPDFPAELKITTGEEDGDASCLVAVIDVSERMQAEQEKERYVQEIELLNDTISRFLRAPVITLLGFVRAINEDYSDRLDAIGRSNLSRVLKHAETLHRYLGDLVEFSGISLRTINKDVVEMKSIAKSVARDISYTESGRNGKIEVDLLPVAYGDSSMVRRAFECLLSNALKATAGHDKPAIAVGGYLHDGENVYFVRDNGMGYDDRYSEKLFLPFQKLHSDSQFPGTGMGLAIVKKIVSKHEGRVWAESKEGEGATFYFSLPEKDAAECIK